MKTMTAALLVTAGCLGGGPADLRYRPSTRVRPLEDAGRVSIYLGRVEARGIFLGSGDRPRLLLKRPVQESIREALGEQCRRLGMKIAGEPGRAGAQLTASLASGEITDQERGSREAVGLVRMTIQVSIEDRDGRPLWDGQLRGTGDIGATGSVADAANAALADAMAQLGPALSDDRVVARILSAGGRP